MNALRWLGVAAVAVLLNPTARAEDTDDYPKLIVGMWEVTKADEGTVPVGAHFELTKDGKIKAAFKKDGEDMKAEGTYKLEKATLSVTLKIGEEEQSNKVTITKLTEKEMTVKDDDGKVVELKKK